MDSHKVWGIIIVGIVVIFLGSIFVYMSTREGPVFGKAIAGAVPIGCGFSGWVNGGTYTLSNDLTVIGDCFMPIVDGITLDCDGHIITGDGTGQAINLEYAGSATIKNCHISDFEYNIYMKNAGYHQILGNTLSNSRYGIYSEMSHYNIITGNIACGNIEKDFYCSSSTGTTGTGNYFGEVSKCDNGAGWPTATDYASCAAASDIDEDGTPDTTDNCPNVANARQVDTDKDGQGNACDADDDNDGVNDGDDNCHLIANKMQLDTDKDGQGNACDPDDDNDGVNDVSDCKPLNAAVYPGATEICKDEIDNDCDGLTDAGDSDCGTAAETIVADDDTGGSQELEADAIAAGIEADLKMELDAEAVVTAEAIVAADTVGDLELKAQLEATAATVVAAQVAAEEAAADADLKAKAEAEAAVAAELVATSTDLELKADLEAKAQLAAEELIAALEMEAATAADLKAKLEAEAQAAELAAAATIDAELKAKLDAQADAANKAAIAAAAAELEAAQEAVAIAAEIEAEEVIGLTDTAGIEAVAEAGTTGPPPPPPTPDQDTDTDGVLDADEPAACRNTPAGKIVESNGCLVGDMNKDGKVDGTDAVPNFLKEMWAKSGSNLIAFNKLIQSMIANWG